MAVTFIKCSERANPQLVVPARQHDAAQLSKFLQHATPATARRLRLRPDSDSDSDCECNWRCMHHAVQCLKYISSGASSCLVEIRKILRKICNQTRTQTVHAARRRGGSAARWNPPGYGGMRRDRLQGDVAAEGKGYAILSLKIKKKTSSNSHHKIWPHNSYSYA